VNKNTVPGETASPFVTSGIRIGTPALTTRGLGVTEMREIARMIDAVVSAPDDEAVLERVRGEVREICARFPLFGSWAQAYPLCSARRVILERESAEPGV